VVDGEVNNVTVLVSSGGISRVIDVENIVAGASSEKHPVSTIVHIRDKTVASRKSVADLRLGRALLAHVLGVAKGIDGSPVNQAATGVSAILGQPGVKRTRIFAGALGSKNHSNRAHGAASRANGFTAGSKLLAAPLAIALLVHSPTIRGSIQTCGIHQFLFINGQNSLRGAEGRQVSSSNSSQRDKQGNNSAEHLFTKNSQQRLNLMKYISYPLTHICPIHNFAVNVSFAVCALIEINKSEKSKTKKAKLRL
jgi:hypothetical protein